MYGLMVKSRVDVPYLKELLETVHEFGRASLELAAWELSLLETELAPAFQFAITRGLLVDPTPSKETGEQEYRLADGAVHEVAVAD
jgi:hypothetical protein